MYYFLTPVWVWILLDRENIVKVFSEIYHQTHTPPIISPLSKPRKTTDPIECHNDGNINDLNKMKLNTGPVTYDIYPHSFRIGVVPSTYGILSQTVLLNMRF